MKIKWDNAFITHLATCQTHSEYSISDYYSSYDPWQTRTQLINFFYKREVLIIFPWQTVSWFSGSPTPTPICAPSPYLFIFFHELVVAAKWVQPAKWELNLIEMHMSMSQCEKGVIVQAITSHHTYIWVHMSTCTHIHTHIFIEKNALHVSELFCRSPRKETPLFLSVQMIICGGDMVTFLTLW